MTKLTDEQEALLDEAATAYANLLGARVQAKAVARKAEQDYLADYQAAWERAAAHYAVSTDDAGRPASKRQLRLATTRNPATVDEAIERGKRFVVAAPAVEAEPVIPSERSRFEVTGGRLRVSLEPEDFEPYATMLVAGVPDIAESHWFDHAGGALSPVDANEDDTWQKPVVQVVMNTPLKAEAIAFLEQNAA
ncbi:hypothetical protein ACI7YT_12410 [Microbacterium sp. M]|uniref:hypothetical protein n=1 Tax=Microbacterium sp. M TaxID=3377125 RepID=UPI0038633B8C